MFAALEILSYILILISAVFKIIALVQLSNKSRDFAISKKKYTQMNIACYLFLVQASCYLYTAYFYINSL